MLVQFRVGNYLSFKDPVTFSMVASVQKEHRETHTFPVADRVSLLKSAVLYGANASGKSNLIRALSFVRRFVLTSVRDTQSGEEPDVESFRLNPATEKEPSLFEMVFHMDEAFYRYGFTVDRRMVHREWLYRKSGRREALLYDRRGQEFEIRPTFREGNRIKAHVRENALLLSVSAQLNGPLSKKIVEWFRRIRIISGTSDYGYLGYTKREMKTEGFPQKVLALLRKADLGIEGLDFDTRPLVEDSFPESMPGEVKRFFMDHGETELIDVSTLHRQFDAEGREAGMVRFSLEENESAGTMRLFALSGPLLDSLENGRILIVDELDCSMHPLLTRAFVDVFHQRDGNPCNAQLLFATHNTLLLDKHCFRRDQVWFVEKDRLGASQLVSLADFKVRNDTSFAKDYLAGRFGAIPLIHDLLERQ